MRIAVFLICWLLTTAIEVAAQTPGAGSMVPNSPYIAVQGPINPGDCVVLVNSYTLGSSGSPCGSGGGGTPCTAGGIDLSLATGCNVAFYIGGVFP